MYPFDELDEIADKLIQWSGVWVVLFCFSRSFVIKYKLPKEKILCGSLAIYADRSMTLRPHLTVSLPLSVAIYITNLRKNYDI